MSWEEVGRETLEALYYFENLSDSEIADRYQISKSKVQYKRKKFGISFRKKILHQFRQENAELFESLNEGAYRRLCQPENIDGIAKALTHYAFRNGPVETMHADGKLSQEDMKTLNQYMVNRLAGILEAIADGEWLQLELLYAFYRLYGTDWDPAAPDHEELDLVFEEEFSRLLNDFNDLE